MDLRAADETLVVGAYAFLWWLSDDPALGADARQVMGEPRNQVLVSAASIWEISIKQAKGMLEALMFPTLSDPF